MDKNSKFIIQMGMDQEFYLDAWNGGNEFEWQPDKETAFKMRFGEAERMLERVHHIFDGALLLEV